MAKKVSSPSKIRLKTTATMIRSEKPGINKISQNDKDSTWKSGLNSGTTFEDYRLDVMRLD